MIKVKCKEKGCVKEIEGYTQKHVDSLMAQHMIKHQNEKKDEKSNKKNK